MSVYLPSHVFTPFYSEMFVFSCTFRLKALIDEQSKELETCILSLCKLSICQGSIQKSEKLPSANYSLGYREEKKYFSQI